MADNSERIGWLALVIDEDPDAGTAPDEVAAAAAALGEKYGWWYDPVLSPETAVEIAETVLGSVVGFSD